MKGEIPVTLIPDEDEQLEYKRMVDKHTLMKEIVAFANTRGGRIKIGVDDDHTVTGTNMTADDVSHMIRDGCVPPLAPKIDKEECKSKRVIIVTVNPNGDVPYRTNSGAYYIRVNATVRIASLPELIDLIVKGPHGGTIQFRAQIPQLRDQISTSMVSDAGFDQALTGITTLSKLAMKADVVTKIETVLTVSKLLNIPCSNDEVVRRLLILLAALASRDLVQNPRATPPESVLFEQIIAILDRMLMVATPDPKVTDRTVCILDALHIVGVGCIWAKYDDLFKEVVDAIQLNCDGGSKLTKLGHERVAKLEECATEDSDHPTRRLRMLTVPLIDQHSSPAGYALFRGLL